MGWTVRHFIQAQAQYMCGAAWRTGNTPFFHHYLRNYYAPQICSTAGLQRRRHIEKAQCLSHKCLWKIPTLKAPRMLVLFLPQNKPVWTLCFNVNVCYEVRHVIEPKQKIGALLETAQLFLWTKNKVREPPRSIFPSPKSEMASQLRNERGMEGVCLSVTECHFNYARPILQSSL